MNIGPKIILLAAMAANAGSAFAQTNAAVFSSDKEKASYAIGLFFGNQIKGGNLDVDTDVLVSAMKDVLAGREAKLTQPQAREAIMTYQKAAQVRVLEKNRKEGEAFLIENKFKDGVKILPVALSETNIVEMQYKVLTEGTGAMPGSNDTVSVNYSGKLLNGTEFDSSAKHGGKPAEFPVNHVIRGWTEAMQKMKVGSKWQLFIPASLAYGDRGNQGIEPGSTLIFDVELLDTKAPAPPAAPLTSAQPMTSDIIRVPSADEMKKGAKIEVIKAQDLEKEKQNLGTNAPGKN